MSFENQTDFSYSRFPVRVRAHCNPLADDGLDIPTNPSEMDWSPFYPHFFQEEGQDAFPGVQFLDVGCAYGGGVVCMSQEFPDKIILGVEIRMKVAQYALQRIERLRQGEPDEYTEKMFKRLGRTEKRAEGPFPPFQNCSIMRSNAMRYLPFYFRKGQLEKMFFCFADPHFKKRNHSRRIISRFLLDEYAYVLAPEGMIYIITDVEDLFNWMDSSLQSHPLFERVPEEELVEDLILPIIKTCSEDAQRTLEKNLPEYYSVFRRLPNQKVGSSMEVDGEQPEASSSSS